MYTNLDYTAGIMSHSSWFIEFKKIVKLRQDGLDYEEIKKKCVEENLFGAINERSIRRTTSQLLKRLKSMDDRLVTLFCESDLATQKLINLITVLRNDRLFFEFVYEVYREKVLIGTGYLEEIDLNVFFSQKEIQSEDVAGWTDTTKKKLKCAYVNFMADANLLVVEGKEKKITPPLLDYALEKYLIYNGEVLMVKALTGVN